MFSLWSIIQLVYQNHWMKHEIASPETERKHLKRLHAALWLCGLDRVSFHVCSEFHLQLCFMFHTVKRITTVRCFPPKMPACVCVEREIQRWRGKPDSCSEQTVFFPGDARFAPKVEINTATNLDSSRFSSQYFPSSVHTQISPFSCGGGTDWGRSFSSRDREYHVVIIKASDQNQALSTDQASFLPCPLNHSF